MLRFITRLLVASLLVYVGLYVSSFVSSCVNTFDHTLIEGVNRFTVFEVTSLAQIWHMYTVYPIGCSLGCFLAGILVLQATIVADILLPSEEVQ